MKAKFTIRVYGICIKDGNVLLSKENYSGVEMLKFPGGGLEHGEGTLECLLREMREEFDMDIEVGSHFYTTDFFVSSAFHKDTGVMSIYYLMKVILKDPPIGKIFKEPLGDQCLQWQSLKDWNPKDLTFPIDQKVAQLIIQEFS
jgi:8-oxo-dGTP diphosphatase